MKDFISDFMGRVLTVVKPLIFFAAIVCCGKASAQGPDIDYTPLANICQINTNQTLTVTVTDPDGVPTTGAGVPHLYWKVNVGIWNTVTGTHIGGGQYTFSFGSGIPGQVISYYIVAQDDAGNVSVSPAAGAAGFTTNPPAVATPPTSPEQFIIQNTLVAGTYTIGVGGLRDFLTITDAVNAYNNSCLSGPVTFLLMDNLYSANEIFPITIYNPNASPSRRLTIKPGSGTNPRIEGTNNDAIFRFNGADYVTIDGSNSADPNVTTRNLTIRNFAQNPAATIIWLASAGVSNPATNNIIKNCKIEGAGNAYTHSAIASSGSTNIGALAEAPNSNNTITNNEIALTYNGIEFYGAPTGDAGNVISKNFVGSANAARKLGYRGIYMHNQTGLNIDSNDVRGVASTYGSIVETEPVAGILVSGHTQNVTIQNNLVSDIRNNGTFAVPAFGIALLSETTNGNTRIQNNMIHTVFSAGNADDPYLNPHGIGILFGSGVRLYHNSIQLNNVTLPTPGITSALFIGPGVTTASSLDIRNNIFSNRYATGSRYGLYCSGLNIIFSNINYNNYYVAGNVIGFLGGPRATIGAWQSATGGDMNSMAVNPLFLNAANLHLLPNSPMNGVGTNVGVTTDIDKDPRSTTVPDIGADEIEPPVCSANNGGTVTANVTQICNAGAPILFAAGFAFGAGIDYQWQSSTDNINWVNIPGEKNPTTATPPSITTTTYYRLRVVCNSGEPGYSTTRQIPVNNPSVVSATNTALRCGVGTVTLNASGSAGTTLRWYDVPVNGEILGTGANFITPPIYANDSFYVEANIGGVETTVGAISPTSHGGITQDGLTSWPTFFDILAPTKLVSVDIYPLQSGQAGNLVIYKVNGPNDTTALITIPYITQVSGGNTAQTIPVNLTLPVGNDYVMWSTGYEDFPISGLKRNISSTVYPYNSSEVRITGNGFNPGFYMYYYRWRFSSGCQNTPRRLVKVNLTPPPAVTTEATESVVCANTPTTLTASSANPNYIYTWQPGNLVGNSVSVSPAGPTNYVVFANDGTCAATDTISITMKAMPNPVSATPVTITKCEEDGPASLTVTGGVVNGEIILNEDFNSGPDAPSGWYKNGGTGAFGYRNSVFVFMGYGIKSPDSSRFYFSNGSVVNAAAGGQVLRTPALNASGYTTLTLNFWHHFQSFSQDTVFVQAIASPTAPTGNSDDGWTTVATYVWSQGAANNWVERTLNLNAFAGNPNVYIRWKYKANDDFYYVLDNVRVTGDDAPPLYSWMPVDGLFLDAAGTQPYNGEELATVFASPVVTTDYIALSTAPNGCASRDTATVNIRVAGAVLSGDNTICAGANTNLSVEFTGTPPYSFTYTDGTTPVTISGINVTPYVFAVTPTGNTVYTITAMSDAFCAANPMYISGSATISLTSVGISSWLGNNNDWFDQDNWCGLIPDADIDVIIPTGLAHYPEINADAAAKHITIGTGAALTIHAAGSLSIFGNTVNDGTLVNNGAIRLAGGDAQTFPGGTGTIPVMHTLEADNTGEGVTINRKMRIMGVFKPSAGNITVTDTLTINSGITGTASIDRVGPTVSFIYSGNGTFVVERYIPDHPKAWQLLSAATIGQTVKQAWQENAALPLQNLKPGYGTIMTGHQPSALVSGFDILTPLGSTITTYNSTTYNWDGIPNTNATPVANGYGYMIFVRGDRSVQTHDAPATATTLRSTGKIFSPTDPPPTLLVDAGRFQSVGNPYASAIDFEQLRTTSAGLDAKFYVWDPSLHGSNGYGRYQTIAAVNGWRPLPGSALYPAGTPITHIQSGQAFMVFSTPGGTVNFGENNKVPGNNMVFRTANLGNRAFLHAALESAGLVPDGNATAFDVVFSNDHDADDALKIANFGPNFGIMRNGKVYALEARQPVQVTDTIFYYMRGLGTGNHVLRFVPENMDGGLEAWLVDQFANTHTPVSMHDTTRISITITAAAASRATDRFYVVFRKTVPPVITLTLDTLPVTWPTVKLIWLTHHNGGTHRFKVERMQPEKGWIQIAEVAADALHTRRDGSVAYEYLDEAATAGKNEYRVIALDKLGLPLAEATADIAFSNELAVTVYPNPFEGGRLNVAGQRMPAGKYRIELLNATGRSITTDQFYHPGGNLMHRLKIPVLLPAGSYFLVIHTPEGVVRRKGVAR